MTTIKIEMQNRDVKELILHHAQSQFTGYGHYRITVELGYEQNFKEFRATTNNMPEFDRVQSIEDYDEKRLALYNMIEYEIEERIREWLYFLED